METSVNDKTNNNNSDSIRKRLASQSVITGGGGEEACPPNRKVRKMDHKEKEKILRRAAEESRRSFHLQPHQTWTAPPLVATYVRQQQKVSLPFSYPSLSMNQPTSGISPPLISNPVGTAPAIVNVPEGLGPNSCRPPSFPARVYKRQESDDEDNTESQTHRPVASSSESETGGDKNTYASSIYPRLYSPAHHIPSPFLYMYNRSPLSPLLLVGSPSCPIPSIGSIPSVESSSGCSSMSEGPQEKEVAPAPPTTRVAPDEYHVGVTLPQTDQSDDELSNPPSPIEASTNESEIVDVTGGVHSTLPPPSRCPVIASNNNNSSMSLNHSFISQPTNPSYHPIMNGYTTASGANTSSSGIGAGGNTLPLLPTYQINTNGRRSSGISVSPSSSRGSTPEPISDTTAHRNYTPSMAESDSEEIFCLVPGRLSLLSATQKYRVTLDEVRRRLSGPECLNASVLGGILRRAKSKNGGHHLRQRLEAKGLSLPAGRRKQTELFLLTSLVEGEAVHLATDFQRLCDNFFPHDELAHIIGAQHINTPHIERRISMVQAAQVLIQELQAMVDTVGGPNNLRPDDPSNPYPGLTNFSLLSHGFGNPNISTSLSVVQNYFSELLKVYEGNKGNVPLDFAAQNSARAFAATPTGGNYPIPPGSRASIPTSIHARPKVMKKEKREQPSQCNENH